MKWRRFYPDCLSFLHLHWTKKLSSIGFILLAFTCFSHLFLHTQKSSYFRLSSTPPAEPTNNNLIETSDEEEDTPAVLSFPLQHCNCSRTLTLNSSLIPAVPYNTTTCSQDAYNRGNNQKVVGFSFYGSPGSSKHKANKYFSGIEENLALLPTFYPGWTIRLYYDLEEGDPLLEDICGLACKDVNIDLCYVKELPGNPLQDAAHVFPMMWRFFPTLDPQVDLFVSRDLDSRFSWREVAAVNEWISSGQPIHSMRDHPAHGTSMLGAAWGARISQPNIRHKWDKSWAKMFKDEKNMLAGRHMAGPDQDLLTWYVWSWGKHMSLQHDAYTCHKFHGSIGWPTERKNEPNNYVAAVVAEEAALWKICPKKCRRKEHPEWEHC